MTWENTFINQYPQWYRLERETEKTLNRLTRMEEIKVYLKSPDEYLRRLAIIRLQELKLKDAVGMLEEVLENPGESRANKELAAWSLKSLCLRWNMELFISNKLIYQYTGREKYQDIFKINIESESMPLQNKFTAVPLASRLGMVMGDNQNQQNQEINIETPFSFREWLPVFLNEATVSVREHFAGAAKRLLFSGLDGMKRLNILYLLKGQVLRLKGSLLNKQRKGRKSKTFNAGSLISNFLDKLIYTASYPLRLAIRNKFSVIAVQCIMYYFLTFSDTGISLTKDHFGVSLLEMQNNLLHSDLMETRDEVFTVINQVLSVAWLQVRDFADWIYYKWIEEIGVK